MLTNIVVTLQVEGFHNWPGAKDLLPAVAFLSDRHRHIFHIKAEKQVTHSDRDVEIIMFKNEMIAYLQGRYSDERKSPLHPFRDACEFGPMSCEMIAKELVDKFHLSRCEVLEDNENGAVVYS